MYTRRFINPIDRFGGAVLPSDRTFVEMRASGFTLSFSLAHGLKSPGGLSIDLDTVAAARAAPLEYACEFHPVYDDRVSGKRPAERHG